MVWAAFSAIGKSRIALLDGKQSSSHYIYTLSEFLLSFVHLHCGDAFVFQQDNASIHVSVETRSFLAEQDITVMEWPARSLDLNPIKNVWSLLSAQVYADGKQFSSVSELKAAIEDAWEALSVSSLRMLVGTMTKRCIGMISRQENTTHY